MALTPEQKSRVVAEARRLGLDAEELVTIAEDELGGDEPKKDAESKPAQSGRPLNERLLIGHLPFIKVRELREIWLGLTERIPDDEMTCGEYQAKHGGAGQSGGGTPPEDA